MQYDRSIIISTAGSRKATIWTQQSILLADLYARLKTPARGVESQLEYDRLTKAQQAELKDVGGFVGGSLKQGRRKADKVEGRDIITLDMDNIPAGDTDNILRRLEGLNCGYCVYSTRKHRPEAPRLRILLPTDRTLTADEYEPAVRKIAEVIDKGMRPFDPSTFEASRLMYWPSCCSDGVYVYQWADKPLLSADGLLSAYQDWRDFSEWPQVPGHAAEQHKRLAAKQGDPLAKDGVIGAFCRCYSVPAVLDAFLPGIYVPTDTPDRYTYAGGSTTGGAIVYDDGRFLFSHHATDPCSGKLCNAFDLVRTHMFGAQDEEAKDGTPVNRLPSYKAMLAFAMQQPAVQDAVNREQYDQAVADYAQLAHDVPAEENSVAWMRELTSKKSEPYDRTIDNVMLLLKHDPLLRGRIRLNTFSDRITGTAPLPWETRLSSAGEFQWSDRDFAGLYQYVERVLGFKSRDTIDAALLQISGINSYSSVVEYLNGLSWDGEPRVDTLYIDYFGAADCEYTRAVARKALCAAVARAYYPGTKFDNMTVLCGGQGIGKTTFYQRLGRQWFSNSVGTFEGKEAAELVQGAWLVEIGELEAFSKADVKTVKQFLSRCDDQYRAAYGRTVEPHPRHCVFFGTTNNQEYLKDPTGNRRFWPIDAGITAPTKSVFSDLTEDTVDQIWAEATMLWRLGESLVLPGHLEVEAERKRGEHDELDALQGQIEEFLAQPLPVDWLGWDLKKRSMFWDGTVNYDGELVQRDRVCAIEILRECIGDRRPTVDRREIMRVNNILSRIPGWRQASPSRFGACYGCQRGFLRLQTKVDRR